MPTITRMLEGLKTNTLYNVQIRAKNSIGQWGELSVVTNLTTVKDTTAPAVLSSITLLLLSGVFHLKWAKPADVDLRGGGYKVYVYTSNTPASAKLIKEVGYTSDSIEIFIGEKTQDASITITAATTYYFWVTTLDDSGNESAKVATTPASGSVSATLTSAYTTVQDEGVGLTQRTTINFIGVGVTASDVGGVTTVDIPGGGGGITWNEVTGTSQAMIINNGYICNNVALVTCTLPVTVALGSMFEICGKGTGGWKLAQNASQIIHFGNLNTTTGTGGYLASTLTYDAIRLVCITANTDFEILSSIGNITVV